MTGRRILPDEGHTSMTRNLAGRSLLLLFALSASVAPDLGALTYVRPLPGVKESPTLIDVRHITFQKSAPADGEAVSGSVLEIRLFCSGAPLLRGASVRIVTGSRSLVRSSPPAVDPKDPKQLFVKIDSALAPGSYVIQWRCI